jgi:hypothetical protein
MSRAVELPIENCRIWFRCPKRWSALTPTSTPAVRYCQTSK